MLGEGVIRMAFDKKQQQKNTQRFETMYIIVIATQGKK